MRFYFLVFCMALLLPVNPAVAEETNREFYAICVDGQKIGYAVQARSVADGVVTTTEGMNMTIARVGVSITIGTVETSIETVNGKPIGFESVSDFAGGQQKMSGRLNQQGKMAVTTTVMGQTSTQTVDFPKGTVMAEGLRLLQLKNGLDEGTTYNAKVFSPGAALIVDGKVEVGRLVNVDLFGRVVPLVEMKTVMQLPTGMITSVSYVDENMTAQKVIIPMMGMQLELVACDKQFALSDNSVVDFIEKLLVQSPVALPDVSSKESVSYYLKPIDKAQLQIPSTDSQTVRPFANGRVIVTVKPVRAPASTTFPYKGRNLQALEALKPTRYLESDNDMIIFLARQAVGDSKDAAEAVRRIESFVAEYITEKDFSVGYATAAEVAVSRQGDCSEHAVLTAAMCRAVGIPARVVSGLLYVEEFAGRRNVFGGHAWNQAYVGNKWVDLDASKATREFGPGYIALAVGNGDPADFFGMVSTLGYFKIEKITINQ